MIKFNLKFNTASELDEEIGVCVRAYNMLDKIENWIEEAHSEACDYYKNDYIKEQNVPDVHMVHAKFWLNVYLMFLESLRSAEKVEDSEVQETVEDVLER